MAEVKIMSNTSYLQSDYPVPTMADWREVAEARGAAARRTPLHLPESDATRERHDAFVRAFAPVLDWAQGVV